MVSLAERSADNPAPGVPTMVLSPFGNNLDHTVAAAQQGLNDALTLL
jgi:hypothetical protein